MPECFAPMTTVALVLVPASARQLSAELARRVSAGTVAS